MAVVAVVVVVVVVVGIRLTGMPFCCAHHNRVPTMAGRGVGGRGGNHMDAVEEEGRWAGANVMCCPGVGRSEDIGRRAIGCGMSSLEMY